MKLKILSYNIHKGFSFGNRRFTLPQIRTALTELNPDVVLLQEIVGENLQHAQTIPQWPKQTQIHFVSENHWQHSVYGKNAVYPIRHHGNGILSHLPICTAENINISNNRFEQRGLLHAEIELSAASRLHIFNLHLDLTQNGRNRQLNKVIARALNHVPSNAPLLIAGDFNDWRLRSTPVLQRALGVRESFLHLHRRHAISFPSVLPMLPLDRMYYRGMEVLSARCLQNKTWAGLSDHLPILVEVEV